MNMKTESKMKHHYKCVQLLIFFGCLMLSSSLATAQESEKVKVAADPIRTVRQVENGNEDNNKLTISSALRITKRSQRPVIEIIVESDRPFLGGNETFALHVGKQHFQFDRYGDTKAHIMIFRLNPQEFEKTKNGDEVTVTYGGASPDRDEGPHRNWKFGKLDKSKIDQQSVGQNSSQVLDYSHVVVKTPQDGNKMTIRSVLRAAGTTRRPIIEIEVKSDIPFHGGNDIHVLHVGTKKFLWARSGDASTNILIFELTPEEFGELKSGDDVSVTYGMNQEVADNDVLHRVWKFGKLDKSKIDK